MLLPLQITKDRMCYKMYLHKKVYVEDILRKYGMRNCTFLDILPEEKLIRGILSQNQNWNAEKKKKKKNFREIIGYP